MEHTSSGLARNGLWRLRLRRLLLDERRDFRADFAGSGADLAAHLATRSAAFGMADRVRARQMGPVNQPFRAKLSYPYVEIVLSDVSDSNFTPTLQGRIVQSDRSSARLEGSIGLRASIRFIVAMTVLFVPVLLVAMCIGAWFGIISPVLHGQGLRDDAIWLLLPIGMLGMDAYLWSYVDRTLPLEIARLDQRLRAELEGR